MCLFVENVTWIGVLMSKLVIFESEDEQIKIDVNFENETVWLTQKQMAELFGKARSTITEHINNIFLEEELHEKQVSRNFRLTTQHGSIAGKSQARDVKHYNLDVIISVGYRVKSLRGVQFRQWATTILREHLLKGYTINCNVLGDIKTIESMLTEFVAKVSGILQEQQEQVAINALDISDIKSGLQDFKKVLEKL